MIQPKVINIDKDDSLVASLFPKLLLFNLDDSSPITHSHSLSTARMVYYSKLYQPLLTSNNKVKERTMIAFIKITRLFSMSLI